MVIHKPLSVPESELSSTESGGMIGPAFFDSTINVETYRWIIIDFLALLEHSEVNVWFQRDKTHLHTMWEIIQYFRSFLADQLISTGLWSPHSPD